MAENGFRDISPISFANNIIRAENMANTPPPETQTGIFGMLRVGVGNYVMNVTEEGLWLGSDKFETAPFRVDMNGVTTIGGVPIEGAIAIGEAANDVNTHTTTINGGMITTGSITAGQIAANAITAVKIAAGSITGDKIAAATIEGTNIKAGTLTADKLVAKTLTGATMADGTITSLQIQNATITGTDIAGGTITGSNLVGGTITGTQIAAGTITGSHIANATISGSNIVGGTITGANISNATISASKIISITAEQMVTGTLYVGPSYGTGPGSIILSLSTGAGASSTGYIAWGGSNNKIWVDTNQYMGIRANGGQIYFYGGTSPAAVIQTLGQSIFYTGISCQGTFNSTVDSGATIVNRFAGAIASQQYIYLGTSTAYPFLSYFSSNTIAIKGHVDPLNHATYNIGGTGRFWNYVNAIGFSAHSLTSFDSPVKMPSGEEVNDLEALRAIKVREDITHEHNGRKLLDKRTFPVDLRVKAVDDDGKEYDRDANGDVLIPDEKGNLVSRPDADAIDIVQFVSLMYGGMKMMLDKIDIMEEKLSKLEKK